MEDQLTPKRIVSFAVTRPEDHELLDAVDHLALLSGHRSRSSIVREALRLWAAAAERQLRPVA